MDGVTSERPPWCGCQMRRVAEEAPTGVLMCGPCVTRFYSPPEVERWAPPVRRCVTCGVEVGPRRRYCDRCKTLGVRALRLV